MGEKRPRVTGASRLLLDLSREVSGSLDLREVLDTSFVALRRLIDFGGGAIQLIEDGVLVAAATDPPAGPDAALVRIPVGEGISGTIAATGEPVYIPDVWADARVRPERRATGVGSGVRSYFGAPLVLHGQPVGVLQIDAPEPGAFSPEARDLVLAFLPTIAAAVHNASVFARERASAQRSRETQSLKRSFLAVVSHELRTPLTSVSGFGYTLATHAHRLDAETVAEIGQRVWRASRRLERVMADLLDLANVERGVVAVDLHPTDIAPIVRDCVREQTDDAHRMVVEIEPELPRATVDVARLRQIIGNLLSNARKFSEQGTTITVRARRAGDAVDVVVEDEGKGIPGDKHDEIFEPFTQLEPAVTRTVDGLGVGLYLVKQLCDRMNARVHVDSEPGRGARFTVRLRTTAGTPSRAAVAHPALL